MAEHDLSQWGKTLHMWGLISLAVTLLRRSCCGGILVSLHPSVRLSVRPSVCPSVRPSVRPACRPLCIIYSYGWILFILGTNDHNHERVCRAPWPLTLTYIFKVIWPWLRLAQMITIIRRCVTCYVFFRIWKFKILANFWNFSALTLKKKNLQFSMDSFHI